MRKQEQEKEYKNLEKADQEINGVIEEDVTENGEPEEPLGKVSALFSFIVYFISYMIGFVVYLITKHRIAIPFIGMLPALFFFPYSILGKRKRQWGLFFGVCEGFNIIALYHLLSIILKYMKDKG